MPLVAAVIDRDPLTSLLVLPDFVIALAGPLKLVIGVPQKPLYLPRIPHLIGINANLG